VGASFVALAHARFMIGRISMRHKAHAPGTDLEGRVALVTGAGRTIGCGIALALAAPARPWWSRRP